MLDKERSKWDLTRQELEKLYVLRSQLFETAWKLSSDYDFDDKFRLTQKQLSQYSAALLEPDPLKRYERLDAMSGKFGAFPPFWYYKGNAAMEVFKNGQYGGFTAGFKKEAIDSYNKFHMTHFEFLREDVTAAACCLEHISLLEPNDVLIPELLKKAMHFAGDNYDVLQQSIFVNLQLGNIVDIIAALREMIINDYNASLNGILLSKIYFNRSDKDGYERLLAVAGKENVLPWSDNPENAEKLLLNARQSMLADEFYLMVQKIIFKIKISKDISDKANTFDSFQNITFAILKYCGKNTELEKLLKETSKTLKQTIINADDKIIMEFFKLSNLVTDELIKSDFSLQIAEDAALLIHEMKKIN